MSLEVRLSHIIALLSESIFEISGGLESLGKFSKILETESLTSLAASSIFLFAINSCYLWPTISLTDEIDSFRLFHLSELQLIR